MADKGAKGMAQKEADTQEALSIAARIESLEEEQKKCYGDIAAYRTELERIKAWGESLDLRRSHFWRKRELPFLSMR